MRNYFNFSDAYGFGMEAENDLNEDVIEETTDVADTDVSDAVDNPNTQELQEEIPAIIDTTDVTNIVDDLGDTFEEGNTERPVGDIDYIPDELKAEIDAIEAAADPHAQVGDGVGLMKEDPYHEIPGGVDLTDDTDESMVGVDKIKEYAEVDETKVTGNSPNLDPYFREEYDEDRYDDPSVLTGPSNNEMEIGSDNVSINDYGNDTGDTVSELQSQTSGNNDNKDITVSADDLNADENENEALPSAGDVLGTESDEGEEEESEEYGEETEVESDAEDIDTDVESEDVGGEDIEEVDTDVEVDGDTSIDESGSMCSEEHAIVDSLDVELNFDEGTILDNEDQQTAEQAAGDTEVGIVNTALDEVDEMTTVNNGDGEAPEPQTTEVEGDRIETATIDDETLLSDVIGDKAEETSHGDEDTEGFWEGDIPVNGDVDPENPVQQVSEGGEEGDGAEVSGDVDVDEAEDVVEEDIEEEDITEAVDTPEEADVEIGNAEADEPIEDIEEGSEEVEDIEEE